MAEQGRWVSVPAAHAPAGRGVDLGRIFSGFYNDEARTPRGNAIRYQWPDGRVTVRGPGGPNGGTASFQDTGMRGSLPVWQPPRPVSNAPYQSPFAGRRDANVQAIQQTGRGIPSAAAPRPSAPAPAPAGQRPAAPAASAPAAPAPAAPATPAGQQPASPGAAPAVAGSNPGQWRTQEDLDLARRRAVLDSDDSAAGVKAVRGLLMDEARNRGIDISGGGSIPAIKFLEQQLAKSNANRNGQSPVVSLPAEQRQAIETAGDAAGKVAFAPGAVMPQVDYGSGAVPSLQSLGVSLPANADEIAKAANTYGARAFGPGAVMPQANYSSGQSPAVSLPAEQRQAIETAGDAAGKVAFAPGAVMPQAAYGSGAVPSLVARPANANEIANAGNAAGARAFAPQAVMDTYMRTDVAGRASAGQDPPGQVASWQSAPVFVAPRQDPGREAMLAAHAALGEKPPTTPGEAVLAVGASNAYGTRGGQFKPGNTVNLGEIPADKLPPRNSTGYYSGAAIGNLFGHNWGGNPGNYQQLF